MVIANKIKKYISNIGQNTGTSVARVMVQSNAIMTALVELCQNLNSGKRRIKGLNSESDVFVGRDGDDAPSSSSLSRSRDGSILGVRNARKRFKR